MARDVDGNLHFLNNYLDGLDATEDGDYESDKVEFSGEELYDLLGELSLHEALEAYTKLDSVYPEAGFYGGIEIVNKIKGRLGKGTPDYKKATHLAEIYYDNVKFWFDTKWLTYVGDEVELTESVNSVLADLIHDSDILAPEELVETVIVGNTLIDYLINDNEKEGLISKKVVEGVRLKGVKERLNKVGITDKTVFKLRPERVIELVQENDKLVGRQHNRLQVDNQTADGIKKTVKFTTENPNQKGNELEWLPTYANIYRLFNTVSSSSKHKQFLDRFHLEVSNKNESDPNLHVKGNNYPQAGIIVYYTEEAFIIIDTRVRVFNRQEELGTKNVFNKSVHDVRVKDIKTIVGIL